MLNKDLKLNSKRMVNFSKFQKIMIDDQVIDSQNYTVEKGSTIITLHKDFTKTLKVGKHTITIVFSDGQVVTEFQVEENTLVTPTPKPEDTTNPEGTEVPKPVTTSDNSQIMLYMVVGGISLLMIGGYEFKKYYTHKHN